MLGSLPVTVVASFLPNVEDPWPNEIGLGFPFTAAGAGAVVALVAAQLGHASGSTRDRWTRRGTVLGFLLGVAFYLIAAATQLLSL